MSHLLKLGGGGVGTSLLAPLVTFSEGFTYLWLTWAKLRVGCWELSRSGCVFR